MGSLGDMTCDVLAMNNGGSPEEWKKLGKDLWKVGNNVLKDGSLGEGWDALKLSGGDILLAKAAHVAGAKPEDIKACMLALKELGSEKSVKSKIFNLCAVGGKIGVEMGKTYVKSTAIAYLGDGFADQLSNIGVGEYSTEKIKQYAMAKCREKLGLGLRRIL